jgi:molecular chaperone Hsp31 and glyoxalase 3
MSTELSHDPAPDAAEDNAFFPSPYSLTLYTSKKTDYDGTTCPQPSKSGKKMLVILTEERYIEMQNGKFFSTGNHPVETLLPMFYIDNAGFKFDVATLSGNPAKFEYWAMPTEDETVVNTYNKYKSAFKHPLSLDKIVDEVISSNSPYIGVFIPGGHGVLAEIPESKSVKKILNWALNNNKYIISLCHGPAAFLATSIDEKPENFPFKGYKMAVFPDSLDTGANQQIGYMPGLLKWLVAEKLEELGVDVINKDLTGKVFKDRKVLTGDSPLASNNLGKLAAETLLADKELNESAVYM